MRRIIAAGSIALLFAPVSYAQQVFDGINLQLGAGASFVSSSMKTVSGAPLITDELNVQNFSFNKTNFTGTIAAGYSKSWGSFSGAVNIFYNIGSENYGSAQNANGIKRQGNINNVFGVVFEPGYYATQNLLVYAKLGAAWANLKVTYPDYSEADIPTQSFGTSTAFLYGLGVKYAMNKNWYVGAEIYQADFQQKSLSVGDANFYSTSSYKPRYNYAGIMIGYTF